MTIIDFNSLAGMFAVSFRVGYVLRNLRDFSTILLWGMGCFDHQSYCREGFGLLVHLHFPCQHPSIHIQHGFFCHQLWPTKRRRQSQKLSSSPSSTAGTEKSRRRFPSSESGISYSFGCHFSGESWLNFQVNLEKYRMEMAPVQGTCYLFLFLGGGVWVQEQFPSKDAADALGWHFGWSALFAQYVRCHSFTVLERGVFLWKK